MRRFFRGVMLPLGLSWVLVVACGSEMNSVPPPPPPPGPGMMYDASVAMPDASSAEDASPAMMDAEVEDAGFAMPDATVDADIDGGSGVVCPEDPRCAGELAPDWTLEDFQPESSRYEMTYGLSVFRGRVVLLGFHAGWCSVCVSQVGRMQTLLDEMRADGYTELEFVSVNGDDADDEMSRQAMLYERTPSGMIRRDAEGNPVALTRFPIFQDVVSVQARTAHRAQKNDFYIYDREGRLSRFMSSYGPENVWLDIESGRRSVRAAIEAAYGPLP